MAETVYILCALTSLACAVLLLRGFFRGGARFLLWSGLCFAGLVANNVLLFVDKVILPETVDLSILRAAAALAAMALLVYGLVWDAE